MRQLNLVRWVVLVVVSNHSIHRVGGYHGREGGALSSWVRGKLIFNIVPVNKYRLLGLVVINRIG